MIRFFEFGEDEYNYICKKCMLNEDYEKLLEMEIKEYSRPKMAKELHISIDLLDKMISKLKKKIKKIL